MIGDVEKLIKVVLIMSSAVEYIAVENLVSYPDNPFKIYTGERLANMIQSI
jgi:hypothetical protein